MNSVKVSQQIDRNRRRFFGTAALTLAATQFGMLSFASAQPASAKPSKQTVPPASDPGRQTNVLRAHWKQIKSMRGLSLTLATLKPAPPMVRPSFFFMAGRTTFTVLSTLLRCWLPRDLQDVIVPYLRGYGCDALSFR